jgi:hypothetical protein
MELCRKEADAVVETKVVARKEEKLPPAYYSL